MAFLELSGVSKSYGKGVDRTHVLHDVNLAIGKGEFVAIVGYSGSGKTTLIQILAGLRMADAGTVTLHGKPIRGPGPERGVVFQNYSLLPWLSVLDNVMLAVEQAFPKSSAAERREHCEKYIAMVNLSHAMNKRPGELSGGMRQRVSVARALAAEPQVLLMDEPLGALDALTRATLQDEILQIWERDRKTVVLITNDVDEAVLLADRVIPLLPPARAGEGATLGTPLTVDVPRPRDRRELMHSETFKSLRRHVIGTLTEARKRGREMMAMGGVA